jgi:hypothetical protein
VVLEIIAAILARLQFSRSLTDTFAATHEWCASNASQSVSIAPISASATVVPFTLASP